eukprot:3276937-Amphidinium_carterae.1
MEWPLPDNLWDHALRPGHGRGPVRNLKQLAVRLGWLPMGRGHSQSQVGLCSGPVCGSRPHQT